MSGGPAESKADFAHKLNIALKELVETRGRFRFIIIAGLLPGKRTGELQDECEQLCRILGKSVGHGQGSVPAPC